MEEFLKVLKSQYLETDISPAADMNLKQTIDCIKNKNNNDIFLRSNPHNSLGRGKQYLSHKFTKAMVAAVIITAITSILAVSAPQKAYSIINSVFSHFAKEKALNDNYDKFAKNVNATALSNGIEITVDKCVADSLGVTIGYRLQSEKPIKGGTLVLSKIKMDGKVFSPEASTNTYKDLGNNQYEGYYNLKIKNLPANFSMDLEINIIGDVSGNWNVKINGSTDETSKNSYFSTGSLEKTSPNGTLRITKIVETPLSTMVSLMYKSNNPIDSDDKIPWTNVMILSEGNKMVTVDSVNSRVVDKFTYETEFYLKDYMGSLSNLRIVPYKAPEIKTEPRSLAQDNDFYPLNKKIPFIWKCGELGLVKITSLKETKNNITVNCSIEGKYSYFILNSLGVTPKVNISDVSSILNFNPIFYNQATGERIKKADSLQNVTLEFDKDTTYKGDYMLVFQKYLQDIKVYDDLEIVVPNH
jgi:hypothetical protein